MARPKGHTLSRDAWDDVLRLSGKSLPDVAEATPDIPAATLRGLVGGFHGASIPQAHKIARAAGCRNVGTLFPTLIGTPVAQVD